jgi:hypothetical protein
MFGGNSSVTSIDTVIPNPNTCTSNTVAFGNYSLNVPAGNPNIGIFNTNSGTGFSQAGGAVNYIVDGQTSSCSPSEQQTNQQGNPPGGALSVTAGNTVTAATLAFSSCQ